MTDKRKYRKLSHEILGLIGLCAGFSLTMFLVLSGIATTVAETYCFQYDIPMTEFDWMDVDRWIFGTSVLISCCSFSILFLILLGDRIAYIRKITAGIDKLHNPAQAVSIPLEGNNELTALAQAVNEMSKARQELRQRERVLAAEKDQLIRDLSHDIRTPLTSILAYSDFLAQQEIAPEEQKAYLQLIRNKAEQIRDLTSVLLDGTRRNLEHFDDGRLLMEQLIGEFEAELEDRFSLTVNLQHCPAFSARLDVQELRRIFDNLASNVCKYADPNKPVTLTVELENGELLIRLINTILPKKTQTESYGIGLKSIRRIAGNYGGGINADAKNGQYDICIFLRDI